MILRLTHREQATGQPQGAPGSDQMLGSLQLASAEAIGAAASEGDAPSAGPVDPERLARVEMRRYLADPAAPEGRRLVQVTYMESGRMLLDNADGTLKAPGAGRALVMDSRPQPPAPGPSEGGTPDQPAEPARNLLLGKGNRRGTSLFVWEGSLRMDKAGGVVTLDRRVELTHRPLGGTTPIRMMCEHLDAFTRTREGASARTPSDPLSPGENEQLVRAIAQHNVTVESESGMLLTADEVDFDNITKIMMATGLPGGSGRATLIDKRRGMPPLVGRRLKWDLQKDEGEVTEVMPIGAPVK